MVICFLGFPIQFKPNQLGDQQKEQTHPNEACPLSFPRLAPCEGDITSYVFHIRGCPVRLFGGYYGYSWRILWVPYHESKPGPQQTVQQGDSHVFLFYRIAMVMNLITCLDVLNWLTIYIYIWLLSGMNQEKGLLILKNSMLVRVFRPGIQPPSKATRET